MPTPPCVPIPPQHVLINQALFARCLASALDAVGARRMWLDPIDADLVEDIAYETLDRYLGLLALAPPMVS